MIEREIGPTSLAFLNSPDMPETRGELEQRLLEEIERKIGSCNTGNGYCADVLFAMLDHINDWEEWANGGNG